MKFILTAGGQGTKLWPYSKENNPKQFQKLFEGRSLFSYNIETLLKKYSPGDIYISTKKKYFDIVKDQAPQIPEDNYINEPNARVGRGPAEGLAFLVLSMKHPDEPFMLIQADVMRLPDENFLRMIDVAEKTVINTKKYLTGGIEAKYPILGIDYINLGNEIGKDQDISVYEISRFIERPNDYAETEKLVKTHKVVTHSNHGCWYPDLMMDAYKKYRPDWYRSLMQIREVLSKDGDFKKIEGIYSKMDKGMTEEVTKYVLPEGVLVILNFDWVDIGAWSSVYEYFAKDKEIYKKGNVIDLESEGSLVMNENSDKLIAVLGVKDLIIVDTGDILLVIPREKSNKVKEIQKKLKEMKLEKYL